MASVHIHRAESAQVVNHRDRFLAFMAVGVECYNKKWRSVNGHVQVVIRRHHKFCLCCWQCEGLRGCNSIPGLFGSGEKSDTVGLIDPVDYATVGGGVSRHRIDEARSRTFQFSS